MWAAIISPEFCIFENNRSNFIEPGSFGSFFIVQECEIKDLSLLTKRLSLRPQTTKISPVYSLNVFN
jgi:hypothetical protein